MICPYDAAAVVITVIVISINHRTHYFVMTTLVSR